MLRKLFLTIGLLLGCCACLSATEYYVSPTGSDAAPGTQSQPFATLAHAKEIVRQIKDRSAEPITVWLQEGYYFLDKTLVFEPEDSGTAAAPITYAAAPNQKVTLSGGIILKANWSPAGEGMYQCSPPEEIIKHGPIMQLFVGSNRLQRPRLPKEGSFKLPDEESEENDRFFALPGDLPASFKNLNDVEAVILQHWTETRMPIKQLDSKQNMVVLAGHAWRPASWAKGYYFDNVFEALTQPGQWYYDRQTKTLYYRPRPDEKIENLELIVPVTETLIRFAGNQAADRYVHHITFRNLTIGYSAWQMNPTGYSYPQAAAPWAEPENDGKPVTPEMIVPIGATITAVGSQHITLDHNQIAHTGAWAVHFSRGCSDNAVIANDFFDLGAGAVRVGEGAHTGMNCDLTGGNTISDNRISDGCHNYLGATGVWVGHSGQNLVSHNDITGDFQMAISIGWNWDYHNTPARENIIEYNHCHHMGYGPLGSHSIIYTLGFSPGTVIRNNMVNNTGGSGFAIALDEGSSGILIEKNIVHHSDRGFHFNRGCVCNIVQNNIFALTNQAAQVRYGDRPTPDTVNMNMTFRNIYYWKQGKLFYDKYDWPDYKTVYDYNLYFNAAGDAVMFRNLTFEQWQAKGLDLHSKIADPMFVDPDAGDFRLRPESPAPALGFVPIDLCGIGPRTQK